VIASLPLTGSTVSADVAALPAAVEVLRELNGSGRTSVPDTATSQAATSFVPARWRGHLEQTVGQGRGAAYPITGNWPCCTRCSPGCVPGTCGATNAAVLWTTNYLGDALDALRAEGYPVTDEDAAHCTPTQHDHIDFYGTHSFELETDLRRGGRRPLRSPAA